MTRKRRRGIIEKRRRDRINTSLLELRRLVPSAFEKQGSAKLEKAEILQLTVDHLKMIHSKGLDSLAYDPHKYAMDYHTMGFRECATEVARYMVSVEGMDVQDPLRMRLMTHLQCFAAQRELGSKQVVPAPSVNSGWPFPAAAAPPPHGSYAPPPPLPASSSNGAGHFNNPAGSHGQQNGQFDQSHLNYGMMDGNAGIHPSFHPSANPQSRLVASSAPTQPHSGGVMSIAPTMTTLQPVSTSGIHPASASGYPHVNHHPFASLDPRNAGSYANSGNSVKPYRPWGAELAY